ncbi:MAG: hypothetical protein IPQ07_30730 [Myxococcales bacterium]|nr:hypothetical protein [Myxococcales bacterium]
MLVFGSSSTEPGDLYYASRASLGSDFPSPLPLSSLNTTSAESSPHVSADGCRLYFTQVRNGSRDLVVATML